MKDKNLTDMHLKQLYSAPVSEPLVVQAEGFLCTSNLGEQGTTGPDWTNPGLGNDYPGIL